MGINFTPRRGAILMCDFGPDPSEPGTYPCETPPLSVAPEVWKERRVAIISVNGVNHLHGRAPGVCIVVPFSSKPPKAPKDWDVFFDLGAYHSFSKPVWAKCAGLMHVSHRRLDRVASGRSFVSEELKPEDILRVEAGVLAALGLAR